MTSHFQNCDLFAVPVGSLNMHGKTKFGTLGGALISLCLRVFILMYLID